MTNRHNALLALQTETSLHAGVGQQTGGIDLPIQREAHTGWPCVYGSGVKGALRNLAEDLLGEAGKASINLVFGPDTANASDHAGALAVGDARLLLLPVRSLTGHFKWVTCPAALDRLSRDAARLGLGNFSGIGIDPPTEASAGRSAAWQPGADADLFLEEYRFDARRKDLASLIANLASMVADPDFDKKLKRQLVIVDDDTFKCFCDSATPVNAHVRLNSESKTVERGALWYEETLPPETVLYAPMSAQSARKYRVDEATQTRTPEMSAQEILAAVTQTLFKDRPYLQLGGNETVGMGWCRVKIITAAEDA